MQHGKLLNGKAFTIVVCVFVALAATWFGKPESGQAAGKPGSELKQKSAAFLKSLVGTWEGTCRTWFQPDKVADESDIRSEFKPLLDGRLIRHTYTGSMMGKPRTGEETIIFNAADRAFQVSWFDSFHMNYGLLFSEGASTEKGFAVKGRYGVGPGQPSWYWKTVFEMSDDNHLTITAYNIHPDGEEDKAVETVLTRSNATRP